MFIQWGKPVAYHPQMNDGAPRQGPFHGDMIINHVSRWGRFRAAGRHTLVARVESCHQHYGVYRKARAHVWVRCVREVVEKWARAKP